MLAIGFMHRARVWFAAHGITHLEPAAVALAGERRTDDDIAVMRARLANLVPVTREWGEEGLCALSVTS
jgi:DNA-binding GntR family transcriptional regulator